MVFDNKKEHKEFYTPAQDRQDRSTRPLSSFLASTGPWRAEKQAMWF